MSVRKTIIFLILTLGVISLAGTVVFISICQRDKVSSPPLPVEQPKKISASVSLQPENLILTSGEEFTSSVFLKTEKEVVSADLEIIYDPDVLTFQKVTLGEFWQEGKLIGQQINQENGQVLLGIVSFEPASGSENLVSLTFKVKRSVEKPTAELGFGGKTQVAISGGEPLVLEVKKGVVYTIK